jgi:hypothetical protein
MEKKTRQVVPRAKCEVHECGNEAAFGFREIQDTSRFPTKGFISPLSMNWCEGHDNSMRPLSAGKDGIFIDLRSSKRTSNMICEDSSCSAQ